ncbi:unnamed protein product, partial [Allacma fusca]
SVLSQISKRYLRDLVVTKFEQDKSTQQLLPDHSLEASKLRFDTPIGHIKPFLDSIESNHAECELKCFKVMVLESGITVHSKLYTRKVHNKYDKFLNLIYSAFTKNCVATYCFQNFDGLLEFPTVQQLIT